LRITYTYLQVGTFLGPFLAFHLRLTLASFTSVLMTWILDKMEIRLLFAHLRVEQNIGCLTARGVDRCMTDSMMSGGAVQIANMLDERPRLTENQVAHGNPPVRHSDLIDTR
jgi:hypothetical protein